jgi:hypothetical protein
VLDLLTKLMDRLLEPVALRQLHFQQLHIPLVVERVVLEVMEHVLADLVAQQQLGM